MLGALLFVPALALMTFAAAPQKPDRASAKKLMSDGNFKEAYDGFSALALDPADDPAEAGNDLKSAVRACGGSTVRTNSTPSSRRSSWPTRTTGRCCSTRPKLPGVDHQGSIVAGRFFRGPHRGGGEVVNAYERDRVRALQLMVQAMGAAKAEKLGGRFYFSLAACCWTTAATARRGGCST